MGLSLRHLWTQDLSSWLWLEAVSVSCHVGLSAGAAYNMTAGFIKAGKQEVPGRVCKNMEITIFANLTLETASQSLWPYSLCHIQLSKSSSHSQGADYTEV